MKLRNRTRAKLILSEFDRGNFRQKTLWTTLPNPLWGGGAYSARYQTRTGEFLLGIYFQPRAGRWIIKTGSLLEDCLIGQTIGERFDERPAEEIVCIIEAMGLEHELGELIPILRAGGGK